jgi:hypothetical protein
MGIAGRFLAGEKHLQVAQALSPAFGRRVRATSKHFYQFLLRTKPVLLK